VKDLRLDRLIVAYPGDERYRLGERAEAMPLDAVLREVGQLLGKGRDGKARE
jgi:hypothetical protein